jgi:hypothetical protein
MEDLSVYQKLDMVEALVRFNGGKFKYLSNVIPAYKMAEGNWKKLDIRKSNFHLQVQADTGLKFSDVPSERALLGGVARYKDKARMMMILRDSLSEGSAGRSHPSVISAHVEKELLESGFIFQSHEPLREKIASWVEKDPGAINYMAEALLDGNGNEGFWPEHHARYKPERIDKSLYDNQDGILYLKRRDLVDKAILSIYMDNPYAETEFLTRVQGMLCHSNLGASIHHEKASAEKPGNDITLLLKDAFRGSRDGDRTWVMERALKHIRYQYDGLETNRKISPEAGIKMLRSILDKNPGMDVSKPSSIESAVRKSPGKV